MRTRRLWLIEHATDVMTKYLVGKDGKSAYERLFGKAVREEALEFGEGLWWRPPRTESHNVLMEPRWRAGTLHNGKLDVEGTLWTLARRLVPLDVQRETDQVH